MSGRIYNRSTGENLTYSWDFGDGSPLVTTRDAVHHYGPGFYQACLTIYNPCDTLTQCQSIHGCSIRNVEHTITNFGIEISPNPARDMFSIKFKEVQKNIKITLFDLHGSIFHEAKLTQNQQLFSYLIDLSEKAPGVYLIKFTTDESSYVKRVVKW